MRVEGFLENLGIGTKSELGGCDQTQVLGFRFKSPGDEELSPGDVCRIAMFWLLFGFWEFEGLMGVSVIWDAGQLDKLCSDNLKLLLSNGD